MKQDFVDYVHQSFKILTEQHGLSIATEINESEYYLIEYKCPNFAIEVEKYHREFYVSLYKRGKSEDGVNLFNLMDYLMKDSPDKPKSNYFSKESVDESYRKQINHLANVLFENYSYLFDFFNDTGFEIRTEAFNKYWKEKHPHLHQ